MEWRLINRVLIFIAADVYRWARALPASLAPAITRRKYKNIRFAQSRGLKFFLIPQERLKPNVIWF